MLRAEGHLGPDVVALPSRNRADEVVPLSLGLGDILRFGESLSHLGCATATAPGSRLSSTIRMGKTRLRLQLEDGRTLDAAWEQLTREPRFAARHHDLKSCTLTLEQLTRRRVEPVPRR